MKTRSLITLAVGMALSPVAYADITSVTWNAAPYDYNFSCNGTPTYSPPNASLSLNGSLFGSEAFARQAGVITSDSNSDPSLFVHNFLANDTGQAWVGLTINLYMDRSFTLSGIQVTNPAGWTASITSGPAPNPTPVYYGASEYLAKLSFSAGTPVSPTAGPNNTLDIQYVLTFLGSLTGVHYEQDFVPITQAVPESATVGLICMGGLLLGGSRFARRLRR